MKLKKYIKVNKIWDKIKAEAEEEMLKEGLGLDDQERALVYLKESVLEHLKVDPINFELAESKFGDSKEEKELMDQEVSDIVEDSKQSEKADNLIKKFGKISERVKQEAQEIESGEIEEIEEKPSWTEKIKDLFRR